MTGKNGEKKSSKAIGMQYEEQAAQYLESVGYCVTARNYRCKKGEIDIVARDGAYLCFVEVKFRKTADFGGALGAVNYSKQQRISKAALWYLMENGYGDEVSCRFDVLGITPEGMELIKNAFEFRG